MLQAQNTGLCINFLASNPTSIFHFCILQLLSNSKLTKLYRASSYIQIGLTDQMRISNFKTKRAQTPRGPFELARTPRLYSQRVRGVIIVTERKHQSFAAVTRQSIESYTVLSSCVPQGQSNRNALAYVCRPDYMSVDHACHAGHLYYCYYRYTSFLGQTQSHHHLSSSVFSIPNPQNMCFSVTACNIPAKVTSILLQSTRIQQN